MSPAVPKLLVSVRDASEATDAIAGGADWIDLKEPLAGPLGGVSIKVAREIATKVSRRCPLSAALGELIDWKHSPTRELLEVPEIEVVKLGLAKCAGFDWQNEWHEVSADARSVEKKLAAVIYADWREAGAPSPDEVIECASSVGSQYLLIDTWNKSGSSTLKILGVQNLNNILLRAQRSGFITVLAGKISPTDISLFTSLPVDIVAVRSAVCSAGREGRLESQLVKQIHDNLRFSSSQTAQSTVAI
jgi:uncharacterized protein (UPF0264 family)